jgi:hypothetical protein
MGFSFEHCHKDHRNEHIELVFVIKHVAHDQQRLVLILYGHTIHLLENEFTLSRYGINDGAILHLLLDLRGMISNFDSKEITNSLVSYLLLGNEERANTSIPIKDLHEARIKHGADLFSTFRYDEQPDIFDESQLDLLCNLLMTRGPTNSCIDFHTDGPYATSTHRLHSIIHQSLKEVHCVFLFTVFFC